MYTKAVPVRDLLVSNRLFVCFAGFGDASNVAAMSFTFSTVILAVKVVLNVHLALQTLLPSTSKSEQTEAIQRHFSQTVNKP